LRLACALAWLLCAGCRELPSLPADVCGNHVIEGDETCDGFARDGAQCRPPGAAFACQLDCQVSSDGTPPTCPSGWGCSTENVCRKATGGYSPLGDDIEGNAFSLFVGDFDGDGRADIGSLEPPTPAGGTTLRLHFLDRDGRLADTWSSKIPLLSVAPANVNSDGRSDIIFTNERLGVLLGQADRTLISEPYPTYVLSATRARIFGAIYSEDITGAAALLVLSDRDGQLSLAYPDSQSGSLRPLDQFAGSLDALAGEPVIGEVFEDPQRSPCLDLALALRGSQSVWLYSVCELDPEQQRVVFRSSPERVELRLPDDAAPIAHGPLLADVNGDGHLDVMIETEDGSYIAYGDGLQLSAAERWRAPLDGSAPLDLLLPLAAGDFNGDGKADFVYPSGFELSQSDPVGLGYVSFEKHFGNAWTSAAIADLNDNGFPDVVASSDQNLDIDFFNGTGSNRLNTAVIETDRPVERMTVGDLDGDLIADLAYVDVHSDTRDQVISVAFGNGSGPPGPALVAAHLPGIQQIGALSYYTAQIQGELFVVNEYANANGQIDSAASWLIASGDRAIMCLVELSTFDANGSIETSAALQAVSGHFQSADRVDALVYGATGSDYRNGVWLLHDLGGRGGQLETLNFDFGPLQPLRAAGDAVTPADFALLMAAADLDGDGLDELIVAAPDQSGDHCLIASARVTAPDVALDPPLSLDERCTRSSQLGLADLDGDAAPEIVILTGEPGGPRNLFALWNDGTGHFTSEPQLLADASLGPTAFTPLRNAPQGMAGGKPVLAFVSQDSAYVLHAQDRASAQAGNAAGAGAGQVSVPVEDAAGQASLPASQTDDPAGVRVVSAADGGGRVLRSELLDITLSHATGIAAADVDGDRVGDLIVADGGRVRVLRAVLK